MSTLARGCNTASASKTALSAVSFADRPICHRCKSERNRKLRGSNRRRAPRGAPSKQVADAPTADNDGDASAEVVPEEQLPRSSLRHRRQTLCQKCFAEVVEHHYRSALGEHNGTCLETDSRILVLYNGSWASTGLLALQKAHLDLIEARKAQLANSTQRNKPLVASNFEVLYVDDTVLCHPEVDAAPLSPCTEGEDYIESMRSFVESEMGFKFRVVPLSSVYMDESNGDASVAAEKLLSLMKKISTRTAREQIAELLRWKVVYDLCDTERFTHVIDASCASRLATRVLERMCEGYGSMIPYEVRAVTSLPRRYSTTSEESGKPGRVLLIRPMKDILKKEIVLYVRQHTKSKGPVLRPTANFGRTGRRHSLRHLTEEFVTGLQVDYPSTSHTVLRVAEKLVEPIPLAMPLGAQSESGDPKSEFLLDPFYMYPLPTADVRKTLIEVTEGGEEAVVAKSAALEALEPEVDGKIEELFPASMTSLAHHQTRLMGQDEMRSLIDEYLIEHETNPDILDRSG